ncbi:MAG: porin family protein [Flavobacteriales bacterium]|nr:PorT family protein [Flavobacteriales bacterium]
MRRILSAIFLLASTCLFAQEGHHGPRVGLGLATQSVGGLFQNTNDLLAAPLFGWHFEAPLHPQVSLMPEVLWITKGSVVRNPAQSTRSKTTLRYLEVPLLIKVSTDKAADGLYLLAGPSMGYLLSSRYRNWLNGDLVIDSPYELQNSSRRFQFNGVVGMGMEGPRMAFDIRAQTSLTPFERLPRIQNVVYALTVAYRLGGSKPEPPAEEE